ncbi:MAG: hypothetical protein HOE90_21160 [Bacteriovoracaceae bacterium]|jgi:hypothetical protein|nr:hypothetical protein [Bacteriovoracaceae bacterium]
MKYLTLIMVHALLLTNLAFAKKFTNAKKQNNLTISRYEVKNIISMLKLNADGDDIADCKSDSDCGSGEICVGIGICVPEAKAKAYAFKLPSLLSR